MLYTPTKKGLILKNDEYVEIVCHFEEISLMGSSVKKNETFVSLVYSSFNRYNNQIATYGENGSQEMRLQES